MELLGIPHLFYQLVSARIVVDGREFGTWLSRSGSYRHSTERKQALDVFYRFNAKEGERPLDLCDRMGWGRQIRQMILADYLIANRDRHGANIEVLRGADGLQRLAPLFDNGLSFVFSCCGDEDRVGAFDVMQDVPANNYIGTRSLEENLTFLQGWDLNINSLESSWEDVLFYGLEDVLPLAHRQAMWNMIRKRWQRYEAL